MTGQGRGGWRRLLVAAVVAGAGVLLCLPATGAGAVAAVQDDVLATVPREGVTARLDLVRATGARVTRVDVFWSSVAPTRPARPRDPRDPAYDWGTTDAIVIGLARRKITPIVTVYSTPAWAVNGRPASVATAYNPSAPRARLYADFMQALATRYNGRFRNPGAGPRRLPRVSHLEIWNEPNLKAFFQLRGRSRVGAYTALVRAAYPRIKRANRRAIVIAGVAGPRGSNGNGNVGARSWLNAIVRAKGLRFDAYSQHIYPSAGPRRRTKAFPSWSSIPQILRTLDRKRRGIRLYVTEAGYTTARTPFRSVRVSPRVQRTFLRQMFALPQVRNPRVPVVVWFNLQDNVNWPAGLLRADGTTKPSYAAFRAIARRPLTRAQRVELRR